MSVTRKDLSKRVADDLGISQAKAEDAVVSVIDNVSNALFNGETVTLRGFGSFGTRERNARPGRNPATGDPVEIPASTAPFFKPSQLLKDLVNS